MTRNTVIILLMCVLLLTVVFAAPWILLTDNWTRPGTNKHGHDPEPSNVEADRAVLHLDFTDLNDSSKEALREMIGESVARAVNKQCEAFFKTCAITDARELQLFDQLQKLMPRDKVPPGVCTIVVIVPEAQDAPTGSWEMEGDKSTGRLIYTRVKADVRNPVAVVHCANWEGGKLEVTERIARYSGNRWVIADGGK